jgi:hypothetical protein
MDRYEKIPQKIFIQGEKYTTNQEGLVVLCTETTCNYSSKHFKGVVLESEQYPIGYYSKTWRALTFEKYEQSK